jgi:hypothetical protein
MSNYIQSTNFATKDALPSGDPLKIVKGTEINTEFANIAIAVATKADLASPTFTGSPVLPTGTTGVTQSAGNNSTALATTAYADAAVAAVKAALYPVGSIYFNATNATNPGTLLGFGTWTAFGAGRVPVGFDSTNALFDTAEETGGSANAVVVSHDHTATTTITDPGHAHSVGGPWDNTAPNPTLNGVSSTTTSTGTATTGITAATTVVSTGVTGTNANYQPYITVYMWKRTA